MSDPTRVTMAVVMVEIRYPNVTRMTSSALMVELRDTKRRISNLAAMLEIAPPLPLAPPPQPLDIS